MNSPIEELLSTIGINKKDTYYGENFVSIGLTVAEKMIFKAKKDANLRRKNNNKLELPLKTAGSDDRVSTPPLLIQRET